ncbi:MAG: hypothetical protein EOS72_03270 [Mesorhizobium sp.]|uniref:hypothetical protein n=1 Tax=Mesorhizobium sp. TaxID=1871066 RepID=UPI000FE7C728|nr:hypothetical protein [Mesorhizobium sp.]RWC91689.1 MAG: hypothetical protein EOS72_03270 [Mesorhizobium sp.]
MIRVVTAAFLIGASQAAAADIETVTQKGYGCLEKADFIRSVEFASADDQAAFTKFIQPKFADGSCVRFAQGDKVYLEHSVVNGPICIRPKGEVHCLWTDPSVIQ